MVCWSVPLRCRMFQMLWLDYSHRGAWSGRRWFESDKDQMQTIHLESRMFLPFGRELEISDGCTSNSQSHQNIWWCGGNKCRTKRGHCKLYSKERHIGSLADRLWKITGHHCCSSYYLVYAVCKRGWLGNTWVLPRAKMMLVPMNFALALEFALVGSSFWLSKRALFLQLVSYWEVLKSILIFCGLCFWSA